MITKLQITGKLHYHRKCDFQLSKRKLGYRTLLPLTAPMTGKEVLEKVHYIKFSESYKTRSALGTAPCRQPSYSKQRQILAEEEEERMYLRQSCSDGSR